MKRSSPGSFNFKLAKVIGILIVATAHFYPGTILWVPSSIALFIFGFSSAYFTHLKYGSCFEVVPYWVNKFSRLVCPLLVISGFLILVSLMFSTKSILVWQTPLHIMGLGGVLDWLHIFNASPLGNGMWFFTVLLLFYGAYPLFRIVNQHAWSSRGFLLVAFVSLTYCHFHFPIGYDLWLTAFSFIFGVYIAARPFFLSNQVYLVSGIASVVGMVVLNFILKVNGYNYFLILATSAILALWLREARLPAWLPKVVGYLEDVVLEIYLVHTYLFLSFTGSKFANYVLSMCLIIITAKLLQVVAKHLEEISVQFWSVRKAYLS